MSLFISTRTADQCRSHHQKMEKNYSTCREIINNFRLSIRPEAFFAVDRHYDQQFLQSINTKKLAELAGAIAQAEQTALAVKKEACDVK